MTYFFYSAIFSIQSNKDLNSSHWNWPQSKMLILNRTNNKKDDYNGSGMIESCRTDRCACRRCRSGSCCHWDCSLSVLLYTSLMTLYIVVFFKNPQRCAMYFWKFFQTEWLRKASSSYEFFSSKNHKFPRSKGCFLHTMTKREFHPVCIG